MAGVALAFAVLEVSDSATALGTVLAAHSIPMVVFLLVGGVIADRFGRTLIIQSPTSSPASASSRSRAWSSPATPRCGSSSSLRASTAWRPPSSFPAMASVLPQLVPREQLQQANLLRRRSSATR